MIVYTDDRGRIKDVNTSDDPQLIEVHLDDEGNPFEGWSVDKICCYKIEAVNGRVVMMTPYTDSRNIEFYDRGGKMHDENSEAIFDVAELAGENSEAAYDIAELADENSDALYELADMVADLEERVAALEQKEV